MPRYPQIHGGSCRRPTPNEVLAEMVEAIVDDATYWEAEGQGARVLDDGQVVYFDSLAIDVECISVSPCHDVVEMRHLSGESQQAHWTLACYRLDPDTRKELARSWKLVMYMSQTINRVKVSI